MSPENRSTPERNQTGIGLLAAVFIIVIVGLFGLLIARYTMISSVASAEDFQAAQGLYSAESAAQLRILSHDGGGNLGAFVFPVTVKDFTVTASTDNFGGFGSISSLAVNASRQDIVRKIEIKYIL